DEQHDLISSLVRFASSDPDAMQTTIHTIKNAAIPTRLKLNVFLALQQKLVGLRNAGKANKPKYTELSVAVFDFIVELWSISEKERLDSLEEAQSIYKPATHHIQTQDELDQEEFMELFPDYSTEYDSTVENAPAPSKPVFDDSVCYQVLTLFDAMATDSMGGFSQQWQRAYEHSFDAGVEIANFVHLEPKKSLDYVLDTGFLYICNSRLQTCADSHQGTYDFYSDANVPQAVTIKPVLLRYGAAVDKALSQWPEHDVLLSLSALCRKILSFPVVSPIIKLLVGLEILLVKSDDWERYASKEYSLKNELAELTQVIVRWRKFELETWRDLLDIETKRSAKKVAAQWFHLWKIVTAQKQETGGISSKDILDVLNEFCLGSTIGEFGARLRVLTSFANYCHSLQIARLDENVTILQNVSLFFAQYASAVEAKIEEVKKPILKELREYVQIASWKDVNVFALKESAKRTHHHLNKLMKKYRLGLTVPLKEIIAREHEVAPVQSKTGSDLNAVLDQLIRNQFLSQLHPSCINDGALVFLKATRWPSLSSLYAKSKGLAEALLEQVEDLRTAVSMEELGKDILDRLKDFQSETSTKEGSIKGQKMIRKKAWVDLLKHLAFLGLSARCSQKYAEHQDVVFMNTRPVIEDAVLDIPNASQLLSRARHYHSRNVARLAIVRKLRAQHSPDISSLELEKSISFLDHLMRLSLLQRSYIHSALESRSRFEFLLSQVKSLVDTPPKTSLGRRACKDHVRAAGHLADALYIGLEQTLLVVAASSSKDPSFLELGQILQTTRSEVSTAKLTLDGLLAADADGSLPEHLPNDKVWDTIDAVLELAVTLQKSLLHRTQNSDKFAFVYRDLLE
ncbi:AAA ATPase midasin, partial [Kappamyces sp. JEL0680]